MNVELSEIQMDMLQCILSMTRPVIDMNNNDWLEFEDLQHKFNVANGFGPFDAESPEMFAMLELRRCF